MSSIGKGFKFDIPKLEDFDKVKVDKCKIEENVELRIQTIDLLTKLKNKKKEEIRKKKQEIGRIYKEIEEIERLNKTITRFKILDYY